MVRVRVAYGITNKVSMINPYVAMLSLWTIHLLRPRLKCVCVANEWQTCLLDFCIDFRRAHRIHHSIAHNYLRLQTNQQQSDTKILFTPRNKNKQIQDTSHRMTGMNGEEIEWDEKNARAIQQWANNINSCSFHLLLLFLWMVCLCVSTGRCASPRQCI